MELSPHKRQNIVFSLKVWLTTVILTTIIIQASNYFNTYRRGLAVKHHAIDAIFPYLFGLALSFPYLIVFVLIVWDTDRPSRTVIKRKLRIAGIHLFLSLILCIVVWGNAFYFSLDIISEYLIVTTVAVLFYRLEGRQSPSN